jgi:hypothetical protein
VRLESLLTIDQLDCGINRFKMRCSAPVLVPVLGTGTQYSVLGTQYQYSILPTVTPASVRNVFEHFYLANPTGCTRESVGGFPEFFPLCLQCGGEGCSGQPPGIFGTRSVSR